MPNFVGKHGVHSIAASWSTLFTISCLHQATTVVARMDDDDGMDGGMTAQQPATGAASVVELHALEEQGCYKGPPYGKVF